VANENQLPIAPPKEAGFILLGCTPIPKNKLHTHTHSLILTLATLVEYTKLEISSRGNS